MAAKLVLLSAHKSVPPQETYAHKKDTITATTHVNYLITKHANTNNYVSKKLTLNVLQDASKILASNKTDALLNQSAMFVSKENQLVNAYSMKLKMVYMLIHI